MGNLTRAILFSALICIVQGCTPAKVAPSLTGAEENSYVGPGTNMDYIYRGPPVVRGRR